MKFEKQHLLQIVQHIKCYETITKFNQINKKCQETSLSIKKYYFKWNKENEYLRNTYITDKTYNPLLLFPNLKIFQLKNEGLN